MVASREHHSRKVLEIHNIYIYIHIYIYIYMCVCVVCVYKYVYYIYIHITNLETSQLAGACGGCSHVLEMGEPKNQGLTDEGY